MLNDESPGPRDRADVPPPPPPSRRPPIPRIGPPVAVVTPQTPAVEPPPAPDAPAPTALATEPVALAPPAPDRRPRLSQRAIVAIGAVAVLAGCLALGVVLRGSHSGSSGVTNVSAATPTPAHTDDGAANAASAPDGANDETLSTDQSAPADSSSAAKVVSPAAARLATRRVNISRAIRTHWKNRLAGDNASLSEAYAAYVGPILRRVGTEARWSGEIRADGLRVMTIRRVLVRDITRTSAGAVAWVHTVSDEGGCANWTMRYDIRRVAGRWRIWESTADKATC
jgi:hypothetical protein